MTRELHVTKSILCFWAGCAEFSCFLAYARGYQQGALRVITLEKLDIEGGRAFALGIEITGYQALGLIGALMAGISLLLSWRLNREPLFSPSHLAALFFLIPLVIAWLIR